MASNKILVIRFSSIGDIVLTTPVVRGLKQQLGAEVHFLTKASFAGIVEPNPYVDQVYTIRKRVREVLPLLKQERYDAVVDLHKNLRSWQVKGGLWVKSYSFDKINLEKWLMVRFRIDRLPRIHIVDRYLGAVSPLGIVNDGRGLDYFIPPADEIDIPSFFASHLPGFDPSAGYVAFVIGAAHQTKRLPMEKILSICRRISLPVVLLGGSSEAEEGRYLAENGGRHVINTCGRLRLHQSASMVRQAGKVITHDTGLMHIAAAFGKEILSVWGNTIPAFGMYPYYPVGMDRNTTFEVKGLSCRPCSKIGFQQCPEGHFRCMNDIDEGEMLKIL